MTSDQLSAIAGILLSLVFSYVPGLKDWYDKQDGTRKRLIMAGALLVVAAGVFALSCANWLTIATCDNAGVMGLVGAFVSALVANQATYLISPKPATSK